MSDQDIEMQFADPDWQPASSRQGRSPGEQVLSAPVEIKNTPNSDQLADQSSSVYPRNGDKAGAYGDYSQGYRAPSLNGPHYEQPSMRIWPPEPGQTPPLTTQSASTDSSSRTGQIQQFQQKSKRSKGRRRRSLLVFPARVALVVIWLTTPLLGSAFYGGWIVPLLGVLFFPLAALMYTIVFAIAGSVTGPAWLWVVGALLLDLASYGRQTNKRRSSPPQGMN